MSELWKPICGYENSYEVSNFGNVRNLETKRILKPQTRNHGYLGVWLYAEKKGKQFSIHRLVAEAFCERCEGQNEVNHLNENKADNRAENLKWCTRKENCAYGEILANKRMAWRNNAWRSKPINQYTKTGEFIKKYPSLHEAYRQTGVPVKSISFALRHGNNAYGFRWEYAI